MRRALVLVLVVLGAAAAPAAAQDYPPAGRPQGTPGTSDGQTRTLRVCRQRTPRCFPRLQDAVNEARPGDTIRVADGTYRGGALVAGATKRSVRIIGNRRDPGRVVLLGTGRPQANGVRIDGAEDVLVQGLTVRAFPGSGVAVQGAGGFHLRDLRTEATGLYGITVNASAGGDVTRVRVTGGTQAGISVAATPLQVRPRRTTIREVDVTAAAVGIAGSAARYVTVTRSRLHGNGTGAFVSAVDGDGEPPSESIALADNDIVDNNAAGRGDVPAGAGVVVLGGRSIDVSANRISGHAVAGVLVGRQPLSAVPDPDGVRIAANRFAGNAADVVSDGSGANVCAGDAC